MAVLDRLRDFRQRGTLDLVALAWRTHPVRLLAVTATIAVGIVGMPSFAVFTGLAVGELPATVAGGLDSPAGRQLVWWATAAGVVFVVTQGAAQARRVWGEVLGQRLAIALRDQALAVCAADHGDLPDGDATRDDLALVAGAARGLPLDRATAGLAEVATTTFSTLGTAVVLFFFHVWVGLCVGAAWVVARLVVTRESHRRLELLFGQATALRRAQYLRGLATGPQAAKEIRVFGLRSWLLDRLHQAWEVPVTALWARRRPGNRRVLLLTAVLVPLYVVLFVVLVVEAARGAVSLAAFAVFLQALIGTAAVFGSAAAYGLDVALAPVAALRRLQQRRAGTRPSAGVAAPPPEPRDALVVDDVRFRYPGAGTDALRGVSLRIAAGESVALVGANGAGKTTLLKLLGGFGRPDAGRILIDGEDLSGLDLVAWRRSLAMVFQDFVRLPLTVADNVTMLRDAGDPAVVRECLDLAGAGDLVADLPDGIDTVLDPEQPGGVDLSGGQWQRLALARACYAVRQGARTLLLDEPTANVDVAGELEIFDRLRANAAGLTTVVVSHRFAVVRRMDRICVFDGGAVIEDGTHDELMAAGGRYHTMFLAQAAPFATPRGVR
ncbi:ABC transporter ATP-binding protein [Actinomycetes bacterium KLBMP 9797]